MKQEIKPKTLNTVNSARYLGMSEGYLRKMRAQDEGPVFIKIGGRRIMYLIADLDSYLNSCRVATAEAA
ncbi:MAG: helix-turn-helix domain-containing protein [Proteobacteria bacterium]|nr:helix-turn-helix domain-containing protein [Pseudomonadota bacterium]